jgi:hypothetical protein
MHANITEWQQDNARHVLEQALKTVRPSVPESQRTDVHTETLIYQARLRRLQSHIPRPK